MTPLVAAIFGAAFVIGLRVVAPGLLIALRGDRHVGTILFAIVLGTLLTLLVHESGHLLGGRLVG